MLTVALYAVGKCSCGIVFFFFVEQILADFYTPTWFLFVYRRQFVIMRQSILFIFSRIKHS